MTATTLSSTSFCATWVARVGRVILRIELQRDLLAADRGPFALISSTARRAPFSLSLPRCEMPPVVGSTLPILTTWSAIAVDAAANAAAASATVIRGLQRMPTVLRSICHLRFECLSIDVSTGRRRGRAIGRVSIPIMGFTCIASGASTCRPGERANRGLIRCNSYEYI